MSYHLLAYWKLAFHDGWKCKKGWCEWVIKRELAKPITKAPYIFLWLPIDSYDSLWHFLASMASFALVAIAVCLHWFVLIIAIDFSLCLQSFFLSFDSFPDLAWSSPPPNLENLKYPLNLENSKTRLRPPSPPPNLEKKV